MLRRCLLPPVLAAALAVPAAAQPLCTAAGPAGTVLELRDGPDGRRTGTLGSGTPVLRLGRRGLWAVIARYEPQARVLYEGSAWAFGPHLRCDRPTGMLPRGGVLSDPALGVPCTVADPAGAALELRDAPSGGPAGRAADGWRVRAVAQASEGGRTWLRITARPNDNVLGWVYRPHLSCQG